MSSSIRITTWSITHKLSFSLPCKKQAVLHVDIREGHVFRVDEDTQVLTDEDLCQHWHEFEVADEAELRQFIQEKAVTKVHKTKVTDDMVVVDCTWVRKFKRMSDGSRKATSRLCARGFLDPQRYDMPTRSTTATRLSQRLVLSMCTLYNMTMESWDISGAFLKGFSFERVRQLLQRKGISTPVRVVAVVPPANTWRHLAKFDASFAVPEHELDEWLLICEKPIYGLNDAPLAWQLNIHDHLESQEGCQSVLDENLFFWKDKGLTALITTHVDDLAVCANRAFLDQQYKALTVKYGKVSQEKLPFSHCGSRYSSTNTGLRMDQSDFCANLKEVPVANSLNDERDLTKGGTVNIAFAVGWPVMVGGNQTGFSCWTLVFFRATSQSPRSNISKQPIWLCRRPRIPSSEIWVWSIKSSGRTQSGVWLVSTMPVRHPNSATMHRKEFWFY